MNTQIKSHIPARKVKPLALAMEDVGAYEDLARIGIGLDERFVNAAMDALEPTITAGSITTPVQFLQNWLPGFVRVVTAARKIDELVGITTAGNWEEEEIVQGVQELTGTSVPYGDYTNVPLSSWNANFERRTVVRFEEGLRVGLLEEARAARIRVDSAAGKRESAALALEIQRNRVGFYGYNNGNNRTYGFLNDPNLPAYVTVATGSGGQTTWASKTFLEITADIRSAISSLRTQSQDVIDPESVDITLAIATSVVDRLTVTSDFGISVRDWLTKTYPRVRVVSAPELNGANGGANVFYLYAENLDDASSDDGKVFMQVVPAKFQALGVQKLVKGYEESYSMATAGILVKRPFAVVRRSGV